MQHHGDKKAGCRKDSKESRGEAKICCGLTEYSIRLEHDEADDEDRKREVDDRIENLRVGCQHCGRIICRRNVAHTLDIVGSCGI